MRCPYGAEYSSEYAAMTVVAQMLGVGSSETIRTWIRGQQVDAGDRADVTTETAGTSAECRESR